MSNALCEWNRVSIPVETINHRNGSSRSPLTLVAELWVRTSNRSRVPWRMYARKLSCRLFLSFFRVSTPISNLYRRKAISSAISNIEKTIYDSAIPNASVFGETRSIVLRISITYNVLLQNRI